MCTPERTLSRWLCAGLTMLALAVIMMVIEPWLMREELLLLPQPVLALAGCAMAMLIAALMDQSSCCGEEGFSKGVRILFWVGIFLLQVIVAFHGYYLSGWDAGIVMNNAYTIAVDHNPLYVDSGYFSTCPNNLLLTFLFSGIMGIFRFFAGDAGYDRCVLVLVVVQCLLNVLTGTLVAGLARRLSGGRAEALAALGYVGLMAFSPWIFVPYTDGYSLIIPTAIVSLAVRGKDGEKRPWILIGILGALGYLIKPQSMIPMIAVLLLEAASLFRSQQRRRALMKVALVLASFCLLMFPLQEATLSTKMIAVDREQNLGAGHYFMIGQNEQNAGMYSFEDLMYSRSFPTVRERTQAQISTSLERIRGMGFPGYLHHLARKLEFNYGDGTFGWGIIGSDFFHEEIEPKDRVLTPLLRSLTRLDGKHFKICFTWMYALWLTMLVMSVPGMLLRLSGGKQYGQALIGLSLFGAGLFNLLFESCPRYTLTAVPLYILGAALGAASLRERMLRKREQAS